MQPVIVPATPIQTTPTSVRGPAAEKQPLVTSNDPLKFACSKRIMSSGAAAIALLIGGVRLENLNHDHPFGSTGIIGMVCFGVGMGLFIRTLKKSAQLLEEHQAAAPLTLRGSAPRTPQGAAATPPLTPPGAAATPPRSPRPTEFSVESSSTTSTPRGAAAAAPAPEALRPVAPAALHLRTEPTPPSSYNS